MRITFVLGAYPPKICGIGDALALIKPLYEQADSNISISVVHGLNWKFEPRRWIREIDATKPDIINFVYPATGLMPHILALYYSKKKTILTCYEFLESHWTRKLSMLAFSTVNQVIWPSEYERASYLKFYPYMKSKSIVRPIFSNIPKAPSQPKLDYIAYFGLFKPGKGLDKFFELADVIKQKGLNYKLLAIGGVLDIYEGYYQKLHARYKDAAIEWYINKTPDEVAMLLAKAKYCYLPFDDGASERRGSLLAALLNGCVVFCKHGAYTPDDMKRVVKNAIEPEQVIAEIYKIEVNGSFENLSEQAEVYAKKFDIHSVVEQNIKLYQTILSEK